MIRDWYNQIPHPALKTKRETAKYKNWQQFTKGTRGKPNESSFPDRWSFNYLKFSKYVTNIMAEPKYKYEQQDQVTVRNHNRSTALERSVLKYWGALTGFTGSQPRPRLLSNRPNHPRVWCFLVWYVRIYVHLKIKYGGNRHLSWNSLRRNIIIIIFFFHTTLLLFCYLRFLVLRIGVCQIVTFTVNFDYCNCHGDHDCSKLCTCLRQWNRFETKLINLNRFF